MRTIYKVRLERDRTSKTPWKAEVYASHDGGKTFWHTGHQEYFTNDAEGQQAMREYIDAHRSPVRVFPLITPERQKAYEAAAIEGTFTRPGFPLNPSYRKGDVPEICGYHGRACRQMNDPEGANRALCDGCPLAEYAHGVELMDYAKGE